jgi:hypothetical protein
MFYTKPGCHLCEDVAEALAVLAERWPLQLTTIDILSDLDLHRQYWDKIPVVVVGETTLYAPITAEMLRAAIERGGRQL